MDFPWTDAELTVEVERAVAKYWSARLGQATRQQASGGSDAGRRSEVTGGLHMDGFTDIVVDLVVKAGFDLAEIRFKSNVELPGFYRSTKKWDLVVSRAGRLCCAIELKSQVGPSFGNNFNNRTEEALGTAVDLWRAFQQGLVGSAQPFLGYFFLLEDTDGSNKPVRVAKTPFETDPVFVDSSYAKRYEILCQRMVLERHYTSAALLLARADGAGRYSEPNADVSFGRFARALFGHLVGCV